MKISMNQYCFKCGQDFDFMEGPCGCPKGESNIYAWVSEPRKINLGLWYPPNVCVLSSHDGSYGVNVSCNPLPNESID